MADDSLPTFIRRFADRHPFVFCYGSAVLISVAALIVVLILPYSRQQPVLLFFEVGVALATWVAGWRAGVVALIGGSFATVYFAQQNIGPAIMLRLVLNLAYTIGIIWVVAKLRFSQEALRQSEERFRRLNAELEQRVAERTAQLQTANEEQRYQVQLLKIITDNASSALYMVDPAGRGRFVNPALGRITGYRDDELMGHVVHDKIHHTKPDGSRYPVHECPLTRAIRDRKTVCGEDLFVRKDRTFFPVKYTASPIFREDRAVGTVIEFEDLTEAKAAERALRDSEELKRRIIESSTDCIKVLDLEGNLLFMSSGGQQLLEIDNIDDYVNGCWIDFWQPEDRPRVREAIAAARAGGIGKFQAFCPSAKGDPRWWDVITTPICNADGQPEQLLSVSRDITERKRAEEAVQRLASIVESSSDAIVSKDLHGIITSWNKGAEHLLGYTATEVIGKPVTIVIPPERHDEEPFILERIRRGEGIDHYETVRRRKDGTLIDISLTVSPIKNADGRIIGASKIARDITDRMRSEEAFREMQIELAHANRLATMGQLTASIAHEVKQPITSSINNAQAALNWLDRRTPGPDEVREALACIVDDGKRASEVIDRIRDLVKKAPQRQDRLEINRAIHQVIELTRSEAIKNGVSVKAELMEGLPPIHGDRVHLQQVMLNLVINAVEAMSCLREEARELLISAGKTESGDVLVAVRDSGPGLAPGTLERVFEPFHTTKPDGLGLGLSICRSIIEAHGGRLWASANVPRGANFQFTVPARSTARRDGR